MPIDAVGAVSAARESALSQVAPAAETDGSAFAATLSGAIDNLQGLNATADELTTKALTGDLTDIHEATIASTKASVTLELVAAVRNKGVEAFNEIMRMQA